MGLGDLFSLFRTVDRLLALEGRHGKAIEELGVAIADQRGRVTRFESREEIVVAEARAAAGVAATQVSMTSVADMARRIGRLEERADQHRLPSPGQA